MCASLLWCRALDFHSFCCLKLGLGLLVGQRGAVEVTVVVAWHIAVVIVVGKFGISKVSTSSKFCILQRAGGCTAQLCLCACFVAHHRFVTRKMSEKKALQYICRANLFILCGECQLGKDLFKIKEVSKTCRVYVLVIYGVDKEKFSKLFRFYYIL